MRGEGEGGGEGSSRGFLGNGGKWMGLDVDLGGR